MALSQSAALHDVASRCAASRALTATHPLGSERRGSQRPAGPCAMEPPLLPASLAPRASHPWAAVPPYPRRAAQPIARRRTRRTSSPPLRAVLRPCRNPYLDLVSLARKKTSLAALRTAIKSAGPSSCGRRAAAVRHGCLTTNSTPACYSSPTRAASHSFRTPYSSCARLLVCSSRQLAGVVSPAAAAEQPSTSSAPRAIPEPTNRLSPFPRPP
jgi:hypothetical protein